MKKSMPLIMIAFMILGSFLVINIYQTRDVIRINSIEKTNNSFNFYVKNANAAITLDDEITFLENQAKKNHISIFKTTMDSETIVKSVVYDQDSFPYRQFGLKQGRLFTEKHREYTSYQSKNSDGHIPTFSNTQKIRLQQLNDTYRDKSNSISGTYTVVPENGRQFNKEKFVNQLSVYFKDSPENMLTANGGSQFGFVNRSLMIDVLLISCATLMMVLFNMISSLRVLKAVGIKKMNGWSNTLIFWHIIKRNIIAMVVAAVMINSIVMYYFSYRPPFFFVTLIMVQLAIAVTYLLSNLLTLVLIHRLTLNMLLKDFVNIKVGMIGTYITKVLVMFSMVAVLVIVSATVQSLTTNHKQSEMWRPYDNTLIMENVSAFGSAAEDYDANNDNKMNRFVEIFKALESQVSAMYVDVQPAMNPTVNLQFRHTDEKNTYHAGDRYDIVHANNNFLKTTNLRALIPQNEAVTRTFFVPIKYKNNPHKVQTLVRDIMYSDLSYDEQKTTHKNVLPVNIVYYDQHIAIFPYKTDVNRMVNNPIIAAFNDKNMSRNEKMMLQNTGIEGTIKIPEAKQQIGAVNRMMNDELSKHNILPKFSSIATSLSDERQTNMMSLRILTMVMGLLFVFSILSSYFVTTVIMQVRKKELVVKKLNGFKMKDRLTQELIMFIGLYVIQIIVLIVATRQITMLPVLLLIIGSDSLITLRLFKRLESKNVVNMLKGE